MRGSPPPLRGVEVVEVVAVAAMMCDASLITCLCRDTLDGAARSFGLPSSGVSGRAASAAVVSAHGGHQPVVLACRAGAAGLPRQSPPTPVEVEEPW